MIKTDFHFQYPDPASRIFVALKRTVGLKVDENKSELENIKDAIGYAHRLFTHNGDNEPSAADPLTILKEAQAGSSFRCVEYSTLATGLLWAYDIPARTIGLKTSDVETREYGAGHVVIEFWSADFKKWIMCDVQAGVIPQLDSHLLSAHDLGQALNKSDSVSYVPVTGSSFSANNTYGDKSSYSEWIKEYLYFIDTPLNLTLGNEDKRRQRIVMLVPVNIKPPKMFQGMFQMNVLYTDSVSDFYPRI